MWLSTPGPRLGASWQTDFLPLRSRAKVVLADLVEELATADAEAFGGPGAVAAAGQQGTLDRAPFDIGQQGTQRQRLTRDFRHGAVNLCRIVGIEVFGQDGPAPRGDRGTRQGVLQLADVSRPWSVPNRLQCLGG